MKKFLAPFAALVLAPALAHAQNFTQFDKLISRVMQLASQAITFLMLLATIFFIWAVIMLIKAKDATAQANAKKQVTGAVVGLAVMVCVWGIIKFAASLVGVDTQNTNLPIPCPPGTMQILEQGRYVCK